MEDDPHIARPGAQPTRQPVVGKVHAFDQSSEKSSRGGLPSNDDQAQRAPANRTLGRPDGRGLMEEHSRQRQQIIASLMPQQPDAIADAARVHWETLAEEITSIIGEAGFSSLFERSLHLAESDFPWLAPGSSPQEPADKQRFAGLATRLATQVPADARAAHGHLLTLFTDILASLIGEQLTANLIRTAWGNLASVTAGKESDNE